MLLTHWRKKLHENIVEKGDIAQNEQFLLFPQCFLFSNYILKSLNNHISIVVGSFFEFGTVTKWCIREWVNALKKKKFYCNFFFRLVPLLYNDDFDTAEKKTP